MKKVFCLSSSKTVLLGLVSVAKNHWEITSSRNLQKTFQFLSQGNWDVVLIDLDITGLDFRHLFESFSRLHNPPPLILACKGMFPQMHDLVTSCGALALLTLSGDLNCFMHRVEHILSFVNETGKTGRPIEMAHQGSDACKKVLLGSSKAMHDVRSKLLRYAVLQNPVLITGETGCGKELAAQLLHTHSLVSQGPFIPINVNCFPETLAESLLFGSSKGCFTDATEIAGCFEQAHKGTLFLDEIATMPLPLQLKFLRAIESGFVCRMGSQVKRPTSFRLVSASHVCLKKAICDGSFREDLFYRIDVLRLCIPPLRERPEDIYPLVHHFLRSSGKRVSHTSMKKLLEHRWPGNVRQLFQCLQRAVADSDAQVINSRQIQF